MYKWDVARLKAMRAVKFKKERNLTDRKVIRIDTNFDYEVFPTVSWASRRSGMDRNRIKRNTQGRTKLINGFKFYMLRDFL